MRFKGLPAEHSARAAEERRIPVVLAGHHEIEERVLLADHAASLPVHPVLHGIKVVVPLGHLNDGDLGIAKEAERAIQEVRARHVIRVERRNEVCRGLLERVVPVTGLRVLVVRTRQIPAPDFVRQRAHLRPAAVVEHVGVVRVVHGHCRPQRLAEEVDVFVVGRDVDVYLEP